MDRAVMPDGVAWTRARYARFLRGTLAAIDAIEPAVVRHLPGFVTGGASRADRLRHDLRALGEDATVERVPFLVDDIGAAFGAAYVVEGSMLGGQHVARALERDLGLGPSHLTYLRAPGGPGPRWAAFVAALDAFGERASAAEWRSTERAAQAAFDAFADAFRCEGLI